MFLNLKNQVLTFNEFRLPQALACELSDIENAVKNNSGECLTCCIDDYDAKEFYNLFKSETL